MSETNTHLQDTISCAQKNATTVRVLNEVLNKELKDFETSKKSLTASIYHIFHTTMSGNKIALGTFKSKCLRLVLDEPGEEEFLTEAVGAVVTVLLDPERKSVDIDLTLKAVDLSEGNLFCVLQKKLGEIGIMLALTNYDNKCTFSVWKN